MNSGEVNATRLLGEREDRAERRDRVHERREIRTSLLELYITALGIVIVDALLVFTVGHRDNERGRIIVAQIHL